MLVVTWPLNNFVAKRAVRIHKGFSAARDARMGVLSELVGAVKFIKFFAWEDRWIARALEAMLGSRGHVQVIEIPYGRYVGAKIGIHNPRGEKVGTVGRLTNIEYLFVVSERRIALPPPQAA